MFSKKFRVDCLRTDLGEIMDTALLEDLGETLEATFGETLEETLEETLGENFGATFGRKLGGYLGGNLGCKLWTEKNLLKKVFLGIPTLDKLMIFIK